MLWCAHQQLLTSGQPFFSHFILQPPFCTPTAMDQYTSIAALEEPVTQRSFVSAVRTIPGAVGGQDALFSLWASVTHQFGLPSSGVTLVKAGT